MFAYYYIYYYNNNIYCDYYNWSFFGRLPSWEFMKAWYHSFSPFKVPPPLCYLKVNCKNINLTPASRVNLIKVLWLTDESFPNKRTDFANSGSQQKYWPRTINTPLECQMGNFSGLVVVILKHCHLIFVGVLSDTRPQRGWLVGGWSNAPISCITGTSWYQLSDYWLLWFGTGFHQTVWPAGSFVPQLARRESNGFHLIHGDMATSFSRHLTVNQGWWQRIKEQHITAYQPGKIVCQKTGGLTINSLSVS